MLSIKLLIAVFFIAFFIIYLYFDSNYNYSKKQVLDKISSKYKPRTELYHQKKGIYNFPFILKPNYCSKSSINVKLVKNRKQLNNYFKNHKKENTIIQEFIPYENEIGVYFEKNPFSDKYKIISITKNDALGGEQIYRKKCLDTYENKQNLITKCTTYHINKV